MLESGKTSSDRLSVSHIYMPIQLHTKPQCNEIKKWDETQSLEHQVWETRTHFSRQHIQVLARVLAALPAHERGGNVASQLQDLSMIFQHHPSTIYTMSIFILQIFAAMTVWIHILLWSTKPLNRRVSIAGIMDSEVWFASVLIAAHPVEHLVPQGIFVAAVVERAWFRVRSGYLASTE